MARFRTYPTVSTDPGVFRQVLSDSPELMVVAFTFEEGAEGPLHAHRQIQSTYVLSGRFRFTIAGEHFEVGPEDSFVIPSGAEHGCLCLAPGRLIDAFTPRRVDFL